jgi:putative transcriptional regulator
MRVADEETFRQFQMELAANPESGDLDSAFGRIAQGSNEIARAWQKLGRASDLLVVAECATLRPFHALHESDTNGHSARDPCTFADGSRNHQGQIPSMKTKTKKKEIEFDAHTLLRRVEGFATGKEGSVERKVKLPPPVRPIPAREIRVIRTRLGFTQAQFASLLNVPKVTAISWENGTRKPSGAALRLLAVARKHPEALEVA